MKVSIEVAEEFIKHYCTYNHIIYKDLKSKSRISELVFHRTILFNILVNYFELTYTASGKMFNRDHATAIHCIKKYEDLVDFYPEYKRQYNTAISLAAMYLEKGENSFNSDFVATILESNRKLRQVVKEKSDTIENLQAINTGLQIRLKTIQKELEYVQ